MNVPRDFQRRAMESCGEALRAGARGVCLVSPTGSGKTFMGAMMVARIVAQGKRVAWGAHRGELCDQAARTLRSFGLEVGIDGTGRSAPVQVGTYQQWCARGQAPDADWFVPDECHHMGDRVGWQAIPRSYRDKGARIIGLTATPARADGRALPDFDRIVVAAQIGQLQERGLLVPLRLVVPRTTLAKDAIAEEPVSAYQRYAADVVALRCAVVFAPHVRAAQKYLADFQAEGVRARLITGTMPDVERADSLARHHAGDVDVLVNCGVLTEGWDNPRCSTCIVGRGCASLVLWIQMAGRVLRPYPGKTEALFIDLRGVAHELGRPDADMEYSLEGEGIHAVEAAAAGYRKCRICKLPLDEGVMVCPECGHDHTPKPMRAVGAELTEWEEGYAAAKSVLKPKPHIASLAGLLRRANKDHWSMGRVQAMFRRIFKRAAYPQEIAQAAALNKAADSYSRTTDPVDGPDASRAVAGSAAAASDGTARTLSGRTTDHAVMVGVSPETSQRIAGDNDGHLA